MALQAGQAIESATTIMACDLLEVVDQWITAQETAPSSLTTNGALGVSRGGQSAKWQAVAVNCCIDQHASEADGTCPV